MELIYVSILEINEICLQILVVCFRNTFNELGTTLITYEEVVILCDTTVCCSLPCFKA